MARGKGCDSTKGATPRGRASAAPANARSVYKLQEELREAEQALYLLAEEEVRAQRAGAWISSGDYLRSPEGRAVEALRLQLQAAQAELGGVVFRIPAENLPILQEKLEKLQKRAAKLGITPLSFTVDPEADRYESTIDPLVAMVELGYVPKRVSIHRYVILDADEVKLNGWMLLASLSVEEGGVMVSKVPAFARAWALHREGLADEAPNSAFGRENDDPAIQNAQQALDAYDLGAYRDPLEATRCDHCHTARHRQLTYLVENPETGEIKVVGRNCLKDFLGTDPNRIASYAELLREVQDSLDEESEERFGSGRTRFLAEDYLSHVCTMLRTNGWGSRSGGEHPTADEAWQNLHNYGRTERGRPLYVEQSKDDHTRAQEAIVWAREVLGEKVANGSASEFEQNMFVAANGDLVPKKGDGILAYLPVAHARYQEKEIEKRERARSDAASKHVGTPGERRLVRARVTGVYEVQGDYGATFITTLRDEDGNVYKWKGSYELDRDEVYEGTFTVSKHDEYKDVKQTVLKRPSNLVKYDPGAVPVVKPTKVGQRVPARADYNGEPVEGEVEKLQKGFRVYLDGEEVGEETTYKRALDTLGYRGREAAQRKARLDYLVKDMPAGAKPKSGSYNPYATHRAYSEEIFVRDGELVALRPKRDGDSQWTYPGAFVPARPPMDNTDSEIVWVPAVVRKDDDGKGTTARAVGPDGVEIPLGEMDVIVRSTEA
jgi:hypothetical protein